MKTKLVSGIFLEIFLANIAKKNPRHAELFRVLLAVINETDQENIQLLSNLVQENKLSDEEYNDMLHMYEKAKENI